jgi:hypothetical protein
MTYGEYFGEIPRCGSKLLMEFLEGNKLETFILLSKI